MQDVESGENYIAVPCIDIDKDGMAVSREDIAGLKKRGIDGAIAGKAVYTGTLDLGGQNASTLADG